MSTTKSLASPLWFPFWFVWNLCVLLGRTLRYVFALALKLSAVILALLGLIAWLSW